MDVPRVLAGDLRSGASRIAEEGEAVMQATASVLRSWQDLPDSLSAPGVIEPLYDGMSRPAVLGADLDDATRAIRGALLRLVDLAEEFGPRFALLRDEVVRLTDEVLAGAVASSDLTDLIPDVGVRLLSGRNDALTAELSDAKREWSHGVGGVANTLADVRAGLDVDLLTGTTAVATAGLSGPAIGDPSRADFDLLDEWLTGDGPRHHVSTAEDPFTRLLRRDDTIRANVATARAVLGEGGWTYRAPLLPPADGTFGRSVGGLKGLSIVAGDARTWLDHLSGGHSGNVADSFLGSYAVTIVPLAKVGARSVRVQFTVSNSITLASGTRARVIGYGEHGEELDRFKNDQVPTGPLSETTQVITWTQVISWPARRGLRRTKVAP